jgi:mannosyltransferase OCH1-like enzyme
MIEKIFHQIWINSNIPELPDQFKRYRDTWLSFHPEWEYRLWNLENLDFVPRCSDLLEKCQHPAQMADLLRIEILHRYGGVYVDVDFECLRPIDGLLTNVNVFACSEDGLHITNSIIGGKAGAEFFNVLIDNVPKTLGLAPVNVETGPVFFTKTILTHGVNNNFTLFPTNYFFPFNYHTPDRHSVELTHSYAVHHYADSWKPPMPRWRKILGKVKRKIHQWL